MFFFGGDTIGGATVLFLGVPRGLLGVPFFHFLGVPRLDWGSHDFQFLGVPLFDWGFHFRFDWGFHFLIGGSIGGSIFSVGGSEKKKNEIVLLVFNLTLLLLEVLFQQ